MLLPLLAAAAIFGLLSLPGWILAADRPRSLWFYAAAGFCSQFAIILVVAGCAMVSPVQLDVRLALVAAVALSGLAWALRRRSGWARPLPAEGWLLLVPVVATVAAALITRSAIELTDDGLLVRAWFNADGFKHLGHVQSLTAQGLPAQDIFAAGGRLAYYWFFYLIPASGAALHGDAAGALIASGLVQTFAFWMLVYGLLRSAGASARWAALLALVTWLSPSPDGIMALATNGWDVIATATQVNIEGVGGAFLNAYVPFRLSLYIPQHQFMLAGLLSWGVLAVSPRDSLGPALRLLSFVPLICAGAVSTLLGIACLGTFAVARLLDARLGPVRRIAGIVAIGLLALAVPLVFGIVDGTGGSGLDSPIFASRPASVPPALRLADAIVGLVLAFGVSLVGLFGLWQGLRRDDLAEESRNTLIFAIALTGTGIAVLLASTLLDNARLAQEIQLRTSLLPYLGLSIGAAWLLRTADNGRQVLPRFWAIIVAPLLAVGMATPVLDWIWHGASAQRWTVQVPAQDLAVLGALRGESAAGSVVLQYPELPFVSRGRDIWSPIFAARRVYASHRSTHWSAQAGRLEQASAFFAGTGPLPEGDYGYVYLSRTLHPDSYDALATRMAGSPGWSEVSCLPDACLWKRD